MADETTDFRRHVPNALTWIRLILAVVFPFASVDMRFWVFVVAAVTEFGDGLLARRWNAVSRFGRILDPIADKLFVLAVFGTLLWDGWIEPWEIAVVALRDLASTLGAGWVLLRHGRAPFYALRPRTLGKLTTNLQFLLILVVLLRHDAPLWLVVPTGALSAGAAVDYVRAAVRANRG